MNLPFSLDFTSWGFFIALGGLVFLSRILPRRALPELLLAASLLYYLCLAPAALPILAAATVAVYFGGLWIADGRKKGRAGLLVGLCLLLLAVTKYLPSLWAGLGKGPLPILQPLGISYFTFSAISYLLDLRKGKLPPQRHFGYLALYLFFFAKITSGPIEKADAFFAQIDRMKSDAQPFENRRGLLLLLCGCIRKLAISNLLAGAVATVFDAPAGQSGWAVLGATLCYTLQIYGDFAGYTDLARGSALLLGVELRENFDHPYLAVSVKDFWRRWHQSLSSWLRDYVYIPLGGNRKGKARKEWNVMITFLLSGIWHGAGLPFLFWGLCHGLLQVAEDLLPWREKLKARFGENSLVYRIPAVGVTFLLVAFCWMPFRAGSMQELWTLWRALAHPGSLSAAWNCLQLSAVDLLTVAAAIFATDRLKALTLPISDVPARPVLRAMRRPGMGSVTDTSAAGRRETAASKRSRPARLTTGFPGEALLLLAALLLLFVAAKNGSGGSFIYVNF